MPAFFFNTKTMSSMLYINVATHSVHTRRRSYAYLYNFEDSPDSRIGVSRWLIHVQCIDS